MMVTVRAAGPADAAALAGLRWAFRSGLASAGEDQAGFVARCEAWMRERLGAPGPWRAWVAEEGGVVRGGVWLQRVEKIPNPVGEAEAHGYLSNLYVQPGSRGGAGSRLLAAALASCDAGGVDTVYLWPTAASRTLYRRHGFRGEGEVMLRARPREAPAG